MPFARLTLMHTPGAETIDRLTDELTRIIANDLPR